VLHAKRIGIVVAVVLSVFLNLSAASAQTTAADVSKKTGEAWDTIKAYGSDKQKEALAHGKQLMKEADDKMAQLEAKSAKASGDAKAQYEKEIKALKASRDKASAKLAEMETSSASAWDDTKKGFADAYKELHQAYGKAVAQFK
jgi:hypothetical protein